MSKYHRMFVSIQFAGSDDGINDETKIRHKSQFNTKFHNLN